MTKSFMSTWRNLACSVSVSAILVLTGCGLSEVGGSPQGEEVSQGEQGRILESGFGQTDEYVYPVTLVENTSGRYGQWVTVSWNILNHAGKVIETETAGGLFGFPGQTIAVISQVRVGGTPVASIEPTLLIEDSGILQEPLADFGTVDATLKDTPGAWTASFPVVNQTSEVLTDLSIDIVCRDAEGKINGGGFEFPELVPPSGEIRVDTFVFVSGEPASCKAYMASRP